MKLFRKNYGAGHEGAKTPREYFPIAVSRNGGQTDSGWAGSRAEE